MKRLFVNVLLVVLLAIGFSSSLLATEVDAAAKSYTTQKDEGKVYFPWNETFEKSINLPMNYKEGEIGGLTYFSTLPILAKCKIEDVKYTLEFDNKIVTAKIAKDGDRAVVLIKPIKVGKTTVKVKISKSGFNTLTRSIVVNVTKSGTMLTYKNDISKNVYTTEFKNTKSDTLIEYNKLFLNLLNTERSKITLESISKGSVFKLKILQEELKILSKSKSNNETILNLKSSKAIQEITDKRYLQLRKLGDMDDHEGLDMILDSSDTYSNYIVTETLVKNKSFCYPDVLVKAYKKSKLHWNILTDPTVNVVGSTCFRLKSGGIVNITNPGAVYTGTMASDILDLDYKYMYLMTPEEKEYYGYDDYDAQTLELDSKENYEESDVLDGFDKTEDYEWSI